MLDVSPPPLRRRGAAAARARTLAELTDRADLASELRRRGLARRSDLERMGVDVTVEPIADEWVADRELWAALRRQLPDVVETWVRTHPLEPGPPLDAVRQALGLPDLALVPSLVSPPLMIADGRVTSRHQQSILPTKIAAAVDHVREDLVDHPFQAPEADRLAELGLGPREIAASVRAGVLLRVADGIVLLPDCVDRAQAVLAGLPQPFTVSAAKSALGTTRRVAVPLLEMLDKRGVTRRLPDSRRVVG